MDAKMWLALGGLGLLGGLLGLSRTSFVVEERIDIDAPVATVWAVLMDSGSYAAWNSQLGWLSGTPALGETLHLRLAAEGAAPYEFSPVVTALDVERRFTWLGRTGLPRVFDGEHTFTLEPLDGDRTRLVNREEYRGVLSPVMERLPMMKGAPVGFAKMNREIQARAEALRPSP